MATEHVNIADGERHEPKGAAAATIGEGWTSNGSESGSFKQPTVALTVKITDISTGKSVWVVSPFDGVIEKIYSVVDGAITVADCGLTAEINGTLVTASAITIPFTAAAAGDVGTATPSGANVVTAGQEIEIISDGLSTGAIDAVITILVRGT